VFKQCGALHGPASASDGCGYDKAGKVVEKLVSDANMQVCVQHGAQKGLAHDVQAAMWC